MKRVLLICLAASLVGCANRGVALTKPGASSSDFDADKARCDYETTASTQGTNYTYNTMFGQELDRALRKNELMTMCMRAKGWSAVQGGSTPPKSEREDPVIPVPPKNLNPGQLVRVRYEPVGMYEEPSTDSTRVDKLYKLSTLKVISRQDEWVRVELDGRQGWVKFGWVLPAE